MTVSASTVQAFTSDHQRLDARSLAMHRLIATRIRANPTLLNQVKATLARWRVLHPDAVCYQEWDVWLNQPLDTLLAFISEDSETATRLRQSAPFCGILTDAERYRFLADYSARVYYSNSE